MVTRIDAHFGNILAALEDPNNDGNTSDSIADNTLVVFQSDNGGPGGQNNIQLDANGGLRGNKGRIQEGGIRVPLVMRWRAKINTESALKAGTSSDRVVDVTDLLPTFCELAGATIPLGIDGVSIAPALLGTGRQRNREFIIHEASNGQSIIRGNYKLVRSKNATLELYDLKADHAEANDIADERPKLVKELETLLLGERVTEPKGFANTYHHWTGKDGASTSDPDNWSDYIYANAGITYMTDDGAPQLSWVARIENKGTAHNTARADTDLEFLGLELRGNAPSSVTQSLVLGPRVSLTGRNEIRLASGGVLAVDGGTVSTLRWVDIQPAATLKGFGSIEGIVCNNGAIVVSGCSQPRLGISSDYHQSAEGKLSLFLDGKNEPSLSIAGDAILDGRLLITTGGDFTPTPGKSYTVLAAEQVTGKFTNPGSRVVTATGVHFTIRYTQSTVTLSVK